jgi:mono/diheme cytochrome c family protein
VRATGAALVVLALAAAAALDPVPIRRLLAVLGGIEQEYVEAFDEHGTLVRPYELDEARLLLADARPLADSLVGTLRLDDDLARLTANLDARAPVDAVVAQVRALRTRITEATGVVEDVLPPAPPSAARGEALFRTHCVSCHGVTGKGDGPDAATATRPPPDFTNPGFMRAETPVDFFHVISLGRRGAAMPAWGDVLPVQERWDLVSHVVGLGTRAGLLADGERIFTASCARCHGGPAGGDAPLGALLDRADADLYASIVEGGPAHTQAALGNALAEPERWAVVAYVRRLTLGMAGGAADLPRALAEVRRALAGAVDAYRLADPQAADRVLDAYLLFEPLERRIVARNAAAVRTAEERFGELRAAMREPGALRRVEAAAAAVERSLEAVARPESTTAGSGWVALGLAGVALAGLAVWRATRRRRSTQSRSIG